VTSDVDLRLMAIEARASVLDHLALCRRKTGVGPRTCHAEDRAAVVRGEMALVGGMPTRVFYRPAGLGDFGPTVFAARREEGRWVAEWRWAEDPFRAARHHVPGFAGESFRDLLWRALTVRLN